MGTVKKLYEIITKKHYNRDEPELETKIEQAIQKFVNENKPIKLIGFWGVGPKPKSNWADLASCEFMNKLNAEIKKTYQPGIEFTFIFATTHGTHNGIGANTIETYTKDIEKVFAQFEFKHLYLKPLWTKYGISFKKINEIFERKPKGWWQKVENQEMIEKNASNRNTHLPAAEGAQKYYIMRDLEKEMLEKEFADSIFHAFADSRLKCVLPNLPTLYFYSRKGWSDTPWFVTKPKGH
jgi:pyoverdine/dityrosine biosynthesis protein Dit1